jgi:general secretion pathway protein H
MNRVMKTAIKTNGGFSLVELLVVLLIIGLGVSFVSMNVAGNNAYQLRIEARNFGNNTSLMAEEAVLSNQQWGVDFFRQYDETTEDIEYYGYRWLVRNDDGLWLEANAQVRQTEFIFSPGTIITLQLDGLDQEQIIELKQEIIDPNDSALGIISGNSISNDEPVLPDIWMLSSGEMSAFRLTLYDQENENTEFVVTGDELGRITIGDEGDDDDY